MKELLKKVFARLSALSDDEFEGRLASVSDDPVAKILDMFSGSVEADCEWKIVKDFSVRSSDELAHFLSLHIEDFEEMNAFLAANDERFALAA